MQFEYDPELLIAQVEKRPALWYAKHADYRAKHLKKRLWSEIAKELMPIADESQEVSKAEMRELELQLQKKWKSLRDCFHKYLGNPKRTRRPYIYSKQLQFLLKDKDFPQCKTKGSRQTSDSEEELVEVIPKRWKKKHKLSLNKDNESEDNAEYLDDYSEDIGVKQEPIESNQFVFANVDSQPKSDYDDSDKMFLISLLPHLKAIPEEFRLNVKMELMNVLKTAQENTSRLIKGGSSR